MYEDIFTQIRNEAKKRNLKENTINAYCNSVDYFLRTVDKDVSALTTDDVNAFLTEKRLGGLAPRTYNHYHSSIRFFYKRILKMNWEDEDIPRMKLDYSLPTVLSRDEMQSIIDHTSNLKHKAIIALPGCGCQKSYIFIMTIFPVPTRRSMSEKAKAEGTDIQSFLTVTSIC